MASKAWQNAGGYIVPYVKTTEIDAYMGEDASYQSRYPQFCRPEHLPRLEDDYILPGTVFNYLCLVLPSTYHNFHNISLFIPLFYSILNDLNQPPLGALEVERVYTPSGSSAPKGD